MRAEPKGTVKFIRRGDTWVLDFRYDERVQAFIKSVPRWAWDYDHAAKKWSVEGEEYAKRVAADLRAAGYKVTGFGAERKLPPPPPPPGAVVVEVNWAEAMFAAVGPELYDKAHRAMARVVHPDIGGSDQLMKELNAARAAVNGDKK
jgi:hypothetical protein